MVTARPPRTSLPAGVRLLPLEMNRDDRGVFTEVFRRSWDIGVEPVQWNFVTSQAGVLRGVHVHVRHVDYLIVLEGRASIGLRDLRRGSPPEGAAPPGGKTGGQAMAPDPPPRGRRAKAPAPGRRGAPPPPPAGPPLPPAGPGPPRRRAARAPAAGA